MSEPKVNLGQSLFQDTWFVANQQLTPYRQLRQIELEIKSIRDSIARNEFSLRRDNIEYVRLVDKHNAAEDPLEKELIKIDMDERNYNINSNKQLIDDAMMRLANFESMKKQLLEVVPKEYWEAGFEQAESDYWKMYLAKQISLSQITGIPNSNILEQMMMLPEQYVGEILQIAQQTTKHNLEIGQKYIAQLENKEKGKVYCCPKCANTWEGECDQSRCIELYGECIQCRFVPVGEINKYGSGSGTKEEFDNLNKEIKNV